MPEGGRGREKEAIARVDRSRKKETGGRLFRRAYHALTETTIHVPKKTVGTPGTKGPGGTPSIGERRLLSPRRNDRGRSRFFESQRRSHAAERRQRRRGPDVHFQGAGGGGEEEGGQGERRVETPSGRSPADDSLARFASARQFTRYTNVLALTCAYRAYPARERLRSVFVLSATRSKEYPRFHGAGE